MSAPPNGLLFGLYRALVIDSNDPKQTGRVKVRIPDIMTNKATCGEFCEKGLWARPGNLQLGGRNVRDTLGPRCFFTDALYQGQCLIPPTGSHVFIFFEKGDPNRPFYFGAADYGQNKILAEHRTGGKQFLKWTPMKTHEGRTLIFSDDPFDARVEITGKKRILHNPPDGDFQSVYQIDNNQTIFMIEERPGHEKVMLKDYHGNYMKMIQDDAGRNDEFHLWMKDDIHIETLKNIYITAHENIHIRAYQDIYINALQNMYVKVTLHFSEMAKLIDRYSETDDNLFATNNINQKCGIDFAMQAGANLKEMTGAACTRKAGGNLADESSASYSVKAAGTASVVGAGGAMVCGPTTTINNGMAPIPALEGCQTAATTPEADDANPDKERYQEVPDPPKPDPVEDKNELWKCDKNLWKPWKPFVESPITQCINAKVGNSGGCGSAGGGGGSGGGSGESAGSGSGGSKPSSASTSLYPSTPAQTPQQGSPSIPQQKISLNDGIKNIINNSPIITQPADSVKNKAVDALNNLKDIVTEHIPEVLDKINKTATNILDQIPKEMDEPLQTVLPMMSTSSSVDKAKDIMNLELCLPCLCRIVDLIFRKLIIFKLTETSNEIRFTQEDLNSTFSDWADYFDSDGNVNDIDLMTQYTYIAYNLNKDKILTNVNELFDNYCSKSVSVSDDVYSTYSTKISSYFDDCLSNSANNIESDNPEDYCAKTIKNNVYKYFDSVRNYVHDSFLKDYMNYVYQNPAKPIDNSLINTFKEKAINLLDNENLLKESIKSFLVENNFSLIRTCESISNEILKKYTNIDYNLEHSIRQNKTHYCHDIDALKSECYITCDEDKQLNDDNPFGERKDDPKYNENSESELGPIIEDLLFKEIKDNIEDSIVTPVAEDIMDLDGEISGTYTIDDIITDIIEPKIIPPGTPDGEIPEYFKKPFTNDIFKLPVVTEIIPDDFNDTFTKVDKPDDPSIPDPIETLTTDISDHILNDIPDPGDIIDTIIPGIVDKYTIPEIDPNVPTRIIKDLLDDSFTPDSCGDCYNEIMKDVDISLGDGNTIDDLLKPVANTVTSIIENFINECDDIPYQIGEILDYPSDDIDKFEGTMDEFVPDLTKKIIDHVTVDIGTINTDITDSITDTFGDSPTQNQLDDVVDDITTEIQDRVNDIIDTIKDGGDPTDKLDEIRNIDPDDIINIPPDKDVTDKVIKDLMELGNDILKPIENIPKLNKTTQDYIKNEIEDLDPIKIYQGHIPTITGKIIEKIGEEIGDIIINDFKTNNPDLIDKLNDELSKQDPDPIKINNIKTQIASKLEPKIKDFDTIVNSFDNIPDLTDIIKDTIKDELPDPETFKEIISDVVSNATKNVIGQIKTAITDNIILNNGVEQDEFNKNVDLTKLYVIPGMIDHTDKNCDFKPPDKDDRYAGYASNPNINGGCGCMYSFLLFLKDKFYKPIYPMLINDGIKTIGFDLNPNMDKYIDTEYIVHDKNIFDDYDEWWNYYSDYKNRPGIQLYFDRINEVMSDAERYGFTVVINMLDFAYKGYKFLEKFEEKDRYTVIMWEDKSFQTYLRDVLRHITTKETPDGKRINRDCLILFNIGNGNYYNLSDPECEKYPMYPTCKFMRELIMFMAYKCNLSSNYIGITHNKDQDLYYYNPYGEFKTYDDQSRQKLEDYNIEYVDVTNDKCIEYDDKGDVIGGYFHYLKECGDTKSYPMAFIPCLKPDNVNFKPNDLNKEFIPEARRAMRYMYLGHQKYFKYKDLEFDENGDVE